MHKSNVHEALQLQLQKSILPTKNLFPPNHEIPNPGLGGGGRASIPGPSLSLPLQKSAKPPSPRFRHL